jgi:SAM-dependent methyltransferase
LGCGDGGFLERARDMGWNAVGCEPDETAVKVCRDAGLEVIHGDIFSEQLNGRQFDVITARHVIEHVPDIDRVLSRIYSIIKPGGTVWFAFPNTNCLSLRFFKAAAVALHIPYHVCIPSRERFFELLNNAGFVEAATVRQGVQSRSNWISSKRIAVEQNLPHPGRVKVYFGGLFSDVLSTISARWGEELVFVARKGDE